MNVFLPGSIDEGYALDRGRWAHKKGPGRGTGAIGEPSQVPAQAPAGVNQGVGR